MCRCGYFGIRFRSKVNVAMSKSFCNGCAHWQWCSHGYGMPGFHYCDKLNTDSLLERKERCNGKYKEDKI